MSTPSPLEVIFFAAREKGSPQERAAYLDGVCAGDMDLRRRVEKMLAAEAQAGSFLERPAVDGVTVPAPPAQGTALHRPASDDAPGSVIGPYKLLQQLGEGGMGTVFMAEQTRPVQRVVALKLIKAGMDSRAVLARFEAERQALALMDHPNIAKVFDAGTTDRGLPYFVMELIKGVPIMKYCDDHQLTCGARLELFVSVCQAVQHAHQKGIIHRDLKPSNVLVCLYDGKPVPKVIDFGVAKATGQRLTDRTLFTAVGSVVGTLEYMSPEQAEVNQLDVDTRSDIYSLGVLLYELLTGTTPLERERCKTTSFLEVLRLIREEEPQRPSTRLLSTKELQTIAANRGLEPCRLGVVVRGELDWIVMKALEKDRNRRYETASAFAADVGRYLNDESVLACPPSAWYRFRKLARRNRRALVTVSVFAVAALIGVGALAVSTVLVWEANKNLKESVDRERKAVDKERREACFQRITVAHRELSIDNLAAALRALHDCPEDLREWEWYCLMRLCKVDPLVIPVKTEANGVVFSPDGERLASAGGDGTITIWDSRTGAVVQTFQAHSDWVVSVAFHPDGKHLASRGADLKLKVWDLTATGQAAFTERCDPTRKFGSSYTVAFGPDGRQLAAGTDGVVKVWDWKNRQLLHSLPGHNFHSIPVVFSGDGRLATGGFREDVKLWNPETGTLLRAIHAHDHPVGALAFSPDGKWLASSSFDRTVKISDSTSGETYHTLPHTGNVECVAVSPDGRRLVSSGEDKTVRVWDATTGREILGLHGHTERCGCVAFSPDGQRLASASTDGTIRIWDATPLRGNEGQETLTFAEHSDEIRSVAFSPDGGRIASAGSDGLVRVWDARTGRVSAEFSGYWDSGGQKVVVFCVAWHPQGHLIASASLGTVTVCDARTGREVFPLPTATGKIDLPYQAVAFSPDGRYLVTGKADGVVRVWDGRNGQEVVMLDTHKREARSVVFSRDGVHLASASSDGTVKLWDATRLNEKQEARLTIRARVPGPSVNVAFSPDGRRLATGGEENTIKIWDVQTGQELQTLRGHRGEVYTLAFSPEDGRWIASAGEDSTVKIWDSRTGKLVHSFRGHTRLVSSLAFSADGKRLCSGSRDKTVKVWDVSNLERP
jgi:WD40 repeat protein/serine/threonine protein kinase